MNSIGEALRRERLRLNLDLAQVARETKINIKMLEAIEAEDFNKLPGGVFTKSFVRQYARMVGLDEDEIAAELQRNIQPEPPPAETAPRISAEPVIDLPRVPDWAEMRPRRGSTLPALAGVVVVMLVCSGIYALWQKARHPASPAGQQTDAAQAGTARPAAHVPAPAAAESQPAAVEPTHSADRTAPPAQTAASNAPPPGTIATPSATPADSVVHVMLTAEEATWVSARADGKILYSGTLQAKETKDLGMVSQVRLVVGNAGGLAITMNGRPVPSIGPKGQVRVVQLSPGGVQIVPRNPAPPDIL